MDDPAIVVDLADPAALADPEGCCELAALALACSDARILVGDARRLGDADVRVVDLLARLALLASRNGCRLRLRGEGADLLELLELCGLTRVLGATTPRTAAATRRAERGARYRGRR